MSEGMDSEILDLKLLDRWCDWHAVRYTQPPTPSIFPLDIVHPPASCHTASIWLTLDLSSCQCRDTIKRALRTQVQIDDGTFAFSGRPSATFIACPDLVLVTFFHKRLLWFSFFFADVFSPLSSLPQTTLHPCDVCSSSLWWCIQYRQLLLYDDISYKDLPCILRSAILFVVAQWTKNKWFKRSLEPALHCITLLSYFNWQSRQSVTFCFFIQTAVQSWCWERSKQCNIFVFMLMKYISVPKLNGRMVKRKKKKKQSSRSNKPECLVKLFK